MRMLRVALLPLSGIALTVASTLGATACGSGPLLQPPGVAERNEITIGSGPDAGRVTRTTETSEEPDEADQARMRAEFDRMADDKRKLEQAATSESADGKDPTGGVFTLAEATATLPGSGALVATIKTSKGDLRCKLFDDKAPNTVANFVGLARGVRPYKSHLDGRWVKAPIYDGTTFHRVIKGFMIQGGDPQGNGTGEPGYVIGDEIWAGAKHDRTGLLCMANRGKNTNGAQFFITDAPAAHLDGNYTIFGECSPAAVVHAISNVPKGDGDRPATPVTINKVEIARDATGANNGPSKGPAGPAGQAKPAAVPPRP